MLRVRSPLGGIIRRQPVRGARGVHLSTATCIALAIAGCGSGADRPSSGPQKVASQKKDLPNIIVLTVDTLRADHLARYGYERNTMPAIEAFFDTAVVFDQAVVPRGSTRPSYSSMLTGLYPFRHGVRSNFMVLHDDLVTLPEMLKEAGYHTAAFVSNFVLIGELSGCDQGFDVYDDRLEDLETYQANYERVAARTLRSILAWLESDPPQPFFLFINLIDPHGPYEPPKRFRALYATDQQRMLRLEDIPVYNRKPGVLNFHEYLDAYDAEIRYADEALGILIEQLKAKRLWDDAFVVFTADHGEAFGEHGTFFEHHGHVMDETTRVPLAIRLPNGANGAQAPAPRRVGGLASPMDLLPTVAALLDIEHAGMLDGRSLLGVLKGAAPAADRALLLEFPAVASPWQSHPDFYAIRTASQKLIEQYDVKTHQPLGRFFFDLAQDRLEQHPINVDPWNETHRKLATQLAQLVAEVRRTELAFVVTEYDMPLDNRAGFVASRKKMGGPHVRALTPEQIDRLRSLGYID